MHRPTLIVGLVFFLVGATFAGVGRYVLEGDRDPRLAVEGREAHAEVLHKAILANRTSGSRLRPAYRVDYRFAPVSGALVTADAEVEAELWGSLAPGSRLGVVYLTSNPSVHRVEGERRNPSLARPFLVIGALCAALGAWLVRGGLPRGGAAPPARKKRPPLGIGDKLGAAIARSPAFVFGLAAVVFALPFGLAGLVWLASVRAEEAAFASEGRAADGQVLSKAVVDKRSSVSGRRSRPSTHYHVSYRFLSERGEEVLGTSALDGATWERLTERGPIRVRYVAGRPWVHRVESQSAAWTGPVVFLSIGGGCLLAGTIAAGSAWPAWSRRRRPRRSDRERMVRAPPPAEAPAPRAASWKPAAPSRWALVFGGVFSLVGSAALVDGAAALREEQRYAAEGLVSEAQLTGKAVRAAERGGRRRTEYVASYRFTTADDRLAFGETELEVSAWEAAKPGDPIRVRYLASAPETNRAAAEGGLLGWILQAALGTLFAGVGGGIAYIGWWQPRRMASRASEP